MIKSAGRLATLLLLCLATAIPSLADSDVCATAANLLTNCGFETGNISGWTFSTGYDYVTKAQPYSGTYALQFGDPGNGQSATISQSFKDTAGANYTVSWAHAVTFTAFVSLYIDGTAVQLEYNPFPYELSAYTFTGTGNDNVTFVANDSPDFGGSAYLDSVSVTPGGETPEPSTMLLTGTGLVGLLLKLKRKRQVSN